MFQIFHTLKAPIDKYYATVLLGAVEILGTIFCVVLIHYTGKRPLVLVSTIGVGLGFFGTATYATFLHSVPGISVDNVVANVSALDLNKANIITVMNVPQILETSLYENFKNATMSNDTIADYEEQSHVMKVRSVGGAPQDEYMIPVSIIDDFNSTNFDFELMTDGIDETESPFNLTIENRTMEATTPATTLETSKNLLDHLVIKIPKAEENRLLWLPLTLLLMSAFFAHMGIKLIPWMLIGEVFPATVRSGASGISGGTGYAFAFLANKMFLKMLATLTLPGTFFFYSAVAFVGAIILYFVLPETEGRSLIEIEEHFSGGLALNQKPNPTNDEEKRCDAGAAVAAVTTRPKTDIIVGVPMLGKHPAGAESDKSQKVHVDLKNWNGDRIFQRHLDDKHENLGNQPHQHHPLYVQNPRAYMRHNNRTKVGDDGNVTVFSTHL